MRTLLQELKEKHPDITFLQRANSFDILLMHENGGMSIDPLLLEYHPITHQEEDGTTEEECDMGFVHTVTRYKTVVDVPVEDLSDEQRAEQSKFAENLLWKIKETPKKLQGRSKKILK